MTSVDSDYAFLYIKSSTIPNAGLGVFSRVARKKDSFLCEYRGQVMAAKSDPDLWKNSSSALYIPNTGLVIIGDTLASRINDCIDLTHKYTKKDVEEMKAENGPHLILHPDKKYNAAYFEVDGHIVVKSIEDIAPDEEIFADYGWDYWKDKILVEEHLWV